MDAHADRDTTIIMAHQTRSLRADELLMNELGRHFNVRMVARNDHVEGFQDEKINIFIINRRGNKANSEEL